MRTLGSRIRIHISGSLETIFWVKIPKFFDADLEIFYPGSGIRDGKISDPRSEKSSVSTPKNLNLHEREAFSYLEICHPRSFKHEIYFLLSGHFCLLLSYFCWIKILCSGSGWTWSRTRTSCSIWASPTLWTPASPWWRRPSWTPAAPQTISSVILLFYVMVIFS